MPSDMFTCAEIIEHDVPVSKQQRFVSVVYSWPFIEIRLGRYLSTPAIDNRKVTGVSLGILHGLGKWRAGWQTV